MRRLVLATTGLWLLAAPAAHADQQIVATAPYRFTTPTVTMAQGERVTLLNQDVAGHDVTAKNKGPDGKPLFGSDLQQQGQEGEVRGAQQLTTGEYPFICSVHPNMTGRLVVTSAGAPLARPGSGAGGSAAAPLKVAASGLDRRARTARSRGRLAVRVAVDQAAFVELAVRVRGAGRLVTLLATTELTQPGERVLRLRLTPAARRALRGRRPRLSIAVAATDAAGNRVTASANRVLR